MATYEGIELTLAEATNRETKTYQITILKSNEPAERTINTYNVNIINNSFLDETLDNSIQNKRITRYFEGVSTNGDGTSAPRRYPLEHSWKKHK